MKYGAGILAKSMKTGRYLLAQRSQLVGTHKGMWAVVGGAMEEGEDTFEAALREFKEETKFDNSYLNKQLIHIYKDEENTYYIYILFLEDEFIPELNWENDAYGWFESENFPVNSHPAYLEFKHKLRG